MEIRTKISTIKDKLSEINVGMTIFGFLNHMNSVYISIQNVQIAVNGILHCQVLVI